MATFNQPRTTLYVEVLEEYINERRNGYIVLLADRVTVNCTPG